MKRGRKRKQGKREPNGRPQRDSVRIDAQDARNRIYFASNGLGAIKVGRSFRVAKRLDELQISSPHELELVGFIDVPSAVEAARLEVNLHRLLKGRGRHIRGEWFKLSQDEVDAIELHFAVGAHP